jgi:hypothetical protein
MEEMMIACCEVVPIERDEILMNNEARMLNFHKSLLIKFLIIKVCLFIEVCYFEFEIEQLFQ